MRIFKSRRIRGIRKKYYGSNLTAAPAAADTIRQNLEDFGRAPKDYDKIITGDLGLVGQKLLFDLLSEMQIDIT